MKKLVLLLVLAFLVPVVYASNFSVSTSLEWLNNQINSTDLNMLETKEIAISALALGQNGYQVDNLLKELEERGEYGYWESLEDSLYATLALYYFNYNVSEYVENIKNDGYNGGPGISVDGFRLTIASQSGNASGSCDLKTDSETVTVQINGTKHTCNDNVADHIQLSSCLSLDNYEKIDISCLYYPVSSRTLSYVLEPTYYILQEGSPVYIKNYNYGGVELSGRAAWVLNRHMLDDAYTSSYVEVAFDKSEDNDLEYAYASLVSEESSSAYVKELQNSQDPLGYWVNPFTTATVYDLLQSKLPTETKKAKEWLESAVREDGSWEENRFLTAYILFTVFTKPKILDPSSITEVCGDGVCSPGETLASCPLDCSSCGDGVITSPEECELNNQSMCALGCDLLTCKCKKNQTTGFEVCDDYIDNDGDGKIDCQDSDCFGNFVCPGGGSEQTNYTPPGTGGEEDGEEGSSIWWWIFIIALILLLIIGGFYLYKKKSFFKKSKKPSFDEFLEKQQMAYPKPQREMPQQQQAPKEPEYSEREKALDESIRKAKEILGRK